MELQSCSAMSVRGSSMEPLTWTGTWGMCTRLSKNSSRKCSRIEQLCESISEAQLFRSHNCFKLLGVCYVLLFKILYPIIMKTVSLVFWRDQTFVRKRRKNDGFKNNEAMSATIWCGIQAGKLLLSQDLLHSLSQLPKTCCIHCPNCPQDLQPCPKSERFTVAFRVAVQSIAILCLIILWNKIWWTLKFCVCIETLAIVKSHLFSSEPNESHMIWFVGGLVRVCVDYGTGSDGVWSDFEH